MSFKSASLNFNKSEKVLNDAKKQYEKFMTHDPRDPFDTRNLFPPTSLLWVGKAFFDELGILRHQIESYNNFIKVLLPRIIAENAILEIDGGEDRKIIMTMSNPTFDSPRYVENDNETRLLFPQEAKDRQATYASSLYLDIEKKERVAQRRAAVIPKELKTQHSKESKETSKKNKKVAVERIWSETIVNSNKNLLAKIPVMVNSILCNLTRFKRDASEIVGRNEDVYDEGGYFIVNGGMKVVVSQERTSFNRIYTFEKNKKTSKFEVYSEVRSSATAGVHTTTTQCGITKLGRILVNIPCIPPNAIVPIGILFKALGILEESQMVSIILYSLYSKKDFDKSIEISIREILAPELEKSSHCLDRDSALLFIGKLGKKFLLSSAVNLAALNEHSKNEDEEDDDGETISAKDDAIEFAKNLLATQLFPHLNGSHSHSLDENDESSLIKAYYFGTMIYKFLCVKLKVKVADDRDHYANKITDTVGILLHNLFYTTYRQYRNECKKSCEIILKKGNAIVNPLIYLVSKTITKRLNSCLSNGNWCGYKNMTSKKNGVSQVYETFNYSARLSNARKCSIPIGENNTKIIPPRRLHNSQYYLMCPFETPEGKHTGLVKNLALTTYISIGHDPAYLIEMFEGLILKITKETIAEYYTKVFINGVWVGFVKDAPSFYKHVKKLKLHNDISIETGVVYDDSLNEIRISTDSGRLCRPLLVVKDNKLLITDEMLIDISKGKLTFAKLCSTGVVELVDPDEAEFILLAERPCSLSEQSESISKKYTHCMVDPSMIFGIGACQTPFANHNQSPRIVYHCAQCKQAVGVPGLNFDMVMDGSYHLLHYPQKPLLMTECAKLIRADMLPTGINTTTAIQPYRGWNQEDSIIICKEFVERGGFHTSHITHYFAEIKKDQKQSLAIPTEADTIGYKAATSSTEFLSTTFIEDDDNRKNYYETITERSVGSKINTTDGIKSKSFQLSKKPKVPFGVIQVGAIVHKGDILIGMVQEIKETNKKAKVNISVTFDADDYGIVKKVQWGRNVNGYRYVKVKVISLKIPVLGDKFSSRFGQKGTCGLFENQENMPFCPYSGIVPDVIINSLAVPSRMTIGQVIECLAGKQITVPKRLKQSERSVFKVERGKAKLMKGKVTGSKGTDGATKYRYIPGEVKEITMVNKKNYNKEYTVFDGSSFQEDPLVQILEKSKESFAHHSPESFREKRKKHKKEISAFQPIDTFQTINDGADRYGKEIMIDGITGKQLEVAIFIGPTYYQRLKHMVDYKIHARARGKNNCLVHQPADGRAQQGGLRFGEMERDCVLGQGASAFLIDRLMDNSDRYTAHVCDVCGGFSVFNVVSNEKFCVACRTSNVSTIQIPYAAKLLMQELIAMGIMPRLLVKKDD